MPAIHILRLRVSGWKAIREDDPVEIDFRKSDGLGSSALILGPNESGKSSLFSMLRFALFEKYNRRGEATNNWVNNDSDEARIEVDIFIDGSSYTIIKTRKSKNGGTSALYKGHGEDKEVLCRGNDADSEILELLGANWKSSKTKEEMPSNWGLLAWLLAPQGMDSVSPARESGTEVLGLKRVMSPELSNLQEILNNSNASELNPKDGKPKTHGNYWSAQQKENELRLQVVDRTNKLEKFSDLMEVINKHKSKINVLNIKVHEAQKEYDSVLGNNNNSKSLLNANMEGLSERLEELARIKIEREDELKILQNIEEELKKSRIIESKAIENEFALRSILDKAILEQRIQDEKETEDERTLEKSRKEHREYSERVKKIDQQKNRQNLVDELNKVKEQEKNHERLLKKGSISDLSEIQKMKSLIDDYKNNQQRIDAKRDVSGLTVESEGEFDGKIIVDGEEHTSWDSPKSFGISLGIHTNKGQIITVKSITQEDDESLLEKRNQLDLQIKNYNCKSIVSVEEKFKNERNRYDENEKILGKLSSWKDRVDLETEISQIALIKFSEDELNDVEIMKKERDAMQNKIDIDAKSHKELRDKNKENRKEIAGHRKEHEKSVISREIYRTSVKEKDNQVRSEISLRGDREKRQGRLNETNLEIKKLKSELKTANASINQKLKSRMSNIKRVKRNLKSARHDYQDIKDDVTRLKFEAEQIGGQNINEELHELSSLHQDASQKLKRIERRVLARDRLVKRIGNKISESTSIETKPIRAKVSEWLYAVTEGKWRRVVMDSNLEINEIHGPQGKMLAGEDYGSHGLQQVIHALIRLAVAVHIYENGKKDNPNFPPVTLVMDESQGHVDEERVKLLTERFNTAIKDGKVQVIALSHRHTEFRNLDPVIEYRVDKRKLYSNEEEE